MVCSPGIEHASPRHPGGLSAGGRDRGRGARRLRPRFGNVLAKADSLHAVCVIYGGQPDAATGKPSLRARLSFDKDGRPVAMGQPETFDTASAVVSVGPVPLADFAPGRYVARVEAIDLVAGKSGTQETAFEIRP